MWCAAMGWHLWRIGTGRPAFQRMSDSRPMALSFLAAYYGAGMLRWAVSESEQAFVPRLLLLVAWMLVIFIAAERPHRSSSLASALLGVSATVDLVVAVLVLNMLTFDQVSGNSFFAIECFLMGLCIARFFQCSKEVQSAGYRYRIAELAGESP